MYNDAFQTEEVVVRNTTKEMAEVSASGSADPQVLSLDQLEAKRLIELQSKDHSHTTNPTCNPSHTNPTLHVQTYR